MTLMIYLTANCNWQVVTRVSVPLVFQTNQGILSMLDDECLKPSHGSDESFLSRLNAACANHPHYAAVGDNSSPAHCFRSVDVRDHVIDECCL